MTRRGGHRAMSRSGSRGSRRSGTIPASGGSGSCGSHSGRKGHKMPLGFVSKKQWRYFFVNPKLRTCYAHKEAHKTPGGPKIRYRRLPTYKRTSA